MAEEKRFKVDSEKIKKAALAGVPLSLTTYVLPHEMELYMSKDKDKEKRHHHRKSVASEDNS